MIWWYDDMMIWWYDMMIWWYDISWPILTYFISVWAGAGPPTHLFASCLVSLRGFFFPKKWRLFFCWKCVLCVFVKKWVLRQEFSPISPLFLTLFDFVWLCLTTFGTNLRPYWTSFDHFWDQKSYLGANSLYSGRTNRYLGRNFCV